MTKAQRREYQRTWRLKKLAGVNGHSTTPTFDLEAYKTKLDRKITETSQLVEHHKAQLEDYNSLKQTIESHPELAKLLDSLRSL